MYKIFPDLITVNSRKYPEKNHLFFKDKVYTYKETGEAVAKAAGVLAANAVKKGDRVAILMENCPEYLFAYFAIVSAGAISVPVNTFLKDREIAINLEDCGAEYLIASASFAESAKALPSLVPTLKKTFAFGSVPFEAIDLAAGEAQAFNISNVHEDDVAALIYTSGTTGLPKGVMLTHKNLVANAHSYSEALAMSHDDRTLLMLPMFHSFSFLACVSGPLVEGTSVIILGSVADMSKSDYGPMLEKLRPTMMLGVPAVYAALTRIKVSPETKERFPFRVCASGGAPMPVEIIKRFQELYGKPLVEGYGLSEAAPGAAVNPLDWQKPGTIGRPLPGIELMVADEDGNELPLNTTGELCVRGDNVMKGYWNSPEETAKVIRNGWLRSGDLATKDEDGFYTIVDRLKDLIIVKGMNLYPREVEELIYQFQGVHSVAVVGVPDGNASEFPVAFVQAEEGVMLDETALKNFIVEKVAPFKVPRRIVIGGIPRTGSGKIDKKPLREKAAELFKA